MKAQPGSIAHNIQTAYSEWFARLRALTDAPLIFEAYTGRWYDGYTPEDALRFGPDPDFDAAEYRRERLSALKIVPP